GVKGRFSTFSASMGLGWRKGAWGSRKRLEEAQQQVFAALKGKEGNPLVAGVGLGNVARAEDDARDAALRQDGGITEIMCASRSGLANAAQELSNHRQPGIDFKRQAGSRLAVGERC